MRFSPILVRLSAVTLLLAACQGTAPATQEAAPASPTAALAATAVTQGTPSAPPTAAPEPTTAPTEAGKIVTFVLLPEESRASYTVDEIFINQNNRLGTAVGMTSVIEGQFGLNYADPATSTFGQFVVNISTLKSDRQQRDNRIRREWLESARFPLATFTVTEVRGFPASPQAGEPIQFQLAGDMLLKETTRPAVWDVTATLNGDRLAGQATTFILLEDYNIPVPSIAGILKVTDGVTLRLDFTFAAQP